jgi:hypothetical protein
MKFNYAKIKYLKEMGASEEDYSKRDIRYYKTPDRFDFENEKCL